MSKDKLDVEEERTAMDRADLNYRRYQYARERGFKEFIDAADRRTAFFFSDQWDPADKAKLARQNRPALTINKIKPTILTMAGEYLANRADVKFVPSSGGTPDIAQAHTKLYIHIANEQKLAKKELGLFFDGIITSRAYYDVRMKFDDNFMGKVCVSSPNPKNVIPDPDSDSDDPADWNEVIIRGWMTVQDVEASYGKAKAEEVWIQGTPVDEYDLDKSNEDNFSGEATDRADEGTGIRDEKVARKYLVIERQYRSYERVAFFVDTALGDMRRVPAEWDDQDIAVVLEENPQLEVRRERAQVIRWTVSTGKVLLHDAISPYDTFTIIPFFPIFVRGKASGGVEDLIDPQLNYNKQRSQELHIVNGTASSGWKVKQGALTNMTTEDLEAKGAATGLVLEFRESADDITRIDPVQVPSGLDRISDKASRDISDISGIDNESRGVARADVAGKAIQARQEAMLVTMSVIFEQLSFTRHLLAKKILRLVQRFYTEERHIRITGGGLRGQVEDLDINVPEDDGSIRNDITVGEYDVVITPAPLQANFDKSQFDELKELQELGIPVPSYLFVEHSNLARKEEIAEELRKAAGTDTPTEEEREIQQMMQEMEMEEKRASISARMAQARLSEARAQKVMSEIEKGDMDEAKIDELLLKARQLDITQEHNRESMEIRRRAQETQELKTLLDADLSREELRVKLMEVLRDREQEQNKQREQARASSSPAKTQSNED